MKCFRAASVLASGLLLGSYCAGALSQTGSVDKQKVSAAPVDYGDEPVAGSTYVPIDSWIYPALDRLQALGYINYSYGGLRPWTPSTPPPTPPIPPQIPHFPSTPTP